MAPNNNKPPKPPEWMGRLPFPPDKKKPVLITRDKTVEIAFGEEENPVRITVYADTNRLYFSEYSVKPGGWFEPPDIHAGDEVYYCAKGHPTLFDPVHGDVIEMNPGDALLIPKGTWHQAFNFGDENFSLITVIAPKAWDRVDVKFEGKTAYYKSKQD